jgi:hypothetical protein
MNFIILATMVCFFLESVPWLYFSLAVVIFITVVLITGVRNQEEKAYREKKLREKTATLFDVYK